ncbi:MAG: hypothetical protein M0Z57_04870 [Deltaproteobacteria bacterium]|jgi:hypothetical protein|uniref:Uncharacterized protein n=1 Tax=Candidatus Acidulodesulfobacterium acidiphilum TaxID=2597224 RepID=A0A520XDS5_9DELT|nr:hypothetical protein [Deltaproteobacteria bacterium]RZV39298.1 MAG: hypothetical protein EVJ48_05060 [Candidatus Acidulodesulfobacterium acidiphilum]
MGNYGYGGNGRGGQGGDLDIIEIAFLVFSGLFALFYFTNLNFKYYINSFYAFIAYSFKVYPADVILYVLNLFLFLAGLHGLYVRIFEIRVSGSKLKMFNKLEKYNGGNNEENGMKP